jgi:hypothetical protein
MERGLIVVLTAVFGNELQYCGFLNTIMILWVQKEIHLLDKMRRF